MKKKELLEHLDKVCSTNRWLMEEVKESNVLLYKYYQKIYKANLLLNTLQQKLINENYVITDNDLDNIMKELGDD